MWLQRLASTFGGWDQPGCGWHLGVATGSWRARTTFQLISQDKYLKKLFFQIFSFSLSLYKDVNWKESFQVKKKKKKQIHLWVEQGQLLMRSVRPCLCDWQTGKENYLNYFKILDHTPYSSSISWEKKKKHMLGLMNDNTLSFACWSSEHARKSCSPSWLSPILGHICVTDLA